ncbi:hypothetical protein [Sphingobacterium thalpophilum]|uniref:hypothetical protein n=1 Tax=Sphingobacterium thalpophilum TaxID=259 RepID=UPI0024A627AF|nr:hypothetical protein [Sphingobacterium thalpophilum]
MPKYQYGCIKAEFGTMDPVTGEITGLTEFDIYQNTIVLDEPEAQRTEHFKQGDPVAKVVRYGNTSKTIAFSVMDVSADSKVIWLGGTKTTVATKDTWNAPKKPVKETTKALVFTLEDGSVITVPSAGCAARLSSNLNDTDIAMIPVVATVKSTNLDTTADFQWTD